MSTQRSACEVRLIRATWSKGQSLAFYCLSVSHEPGEVLFKHVLCSLSVRLFHLRATCAVCATSQVNWIRLLADLTQGADHSLHRLQADFTTRVRSRLQRLSSRGVLLGQAEVYTIALMKVTGGLTTDASARARRKRQLQHCQAVHVKHTQALYVLGAVALVELLS